MIQRLNRNLGTESDLQAGEYATLVAEHIAHTMITVVVACPLCGEKKRLDEHHRVDARTGDVTPAVKCAVCPFFDWVALDGWAEVPK